MRLNQYIALAIGTGRRAADRLIQEGRVVVNDKKATVGQQIVSTDQVALDNRTITPPVKTLTVMLNKPVGYVCSRQGQGGRTVYDLLPPELHHLKPVGRLDKDSSGLLLLSNDGQLAYELTHPKFNKAKVYEVRLDRPLAPDDLRKLKDGILLEDGLSQLDVQVMRHESRVRRKTDTGTAKPHASQLISHNSAYEVRMAEGKNRQIRRTFEHLNYKVVTLHRTHFGPYTLSTLKLGKYGNIV